MQVDQAALGGVAFTRVQDYSTVKTAFNHPSIVPLDFGYHENGIRQVPFQPKALNNE